MIMNRELFGRRVGSKTVVKLGKGERGRCEGVMYYYPFLGIVETFKVCEAGGSY